ncbi:uncharacterized protein LOC142539058 isoform X2 [Primulina tabacum]|uniref:uncharacterized protein LOC142539058 isoform X2 n=1 Tax=Primulina tabacum TaxID=48773 RepID=UPI003F5A2FE7
MLKFKGRCDFCVSEDISIEQRKLLTEFLNREELDVTTWMDEHICLTGPLFCDFLFGELVSGIMINVYMRIMQKKSMDYGFETYCMDTLVQKEVLEDLVRYGKRRHISKTEYGNFIGRLTSATREKLHELNEDLFRRCKYIIFPINDRFHWYLLVFKASEGKFLLFNSLHYPFSVGTANVMARFLSGCVSHISGFTIGSDDVLRERCRQQGTSLDCGVYACMWIECLCCDTEKFGHMNKM